MGPLRLVTTSKSSITSLSGSKCLNRFHAQIPYQTCIWQSIDVWQTETICIPRFVRWSRGNWTDEWPAEIAVDNEGKSLTSQSVIEWWQSGSCLHCSLNSATFITPASVVFSLYMKLVDNWHSVHVNELSTQVTVDTSRRRRINILQSRSIELVVKSYLL